MASDEFEPHQEAGKSFFSVLLLLPSPPLPLCSHALRAWRLLGVLRPQLKVRHCASPADLSRSNTPGFRAPTVPRSLSLSPCATDSLQGGPEPAPSLRFPVGRQAGTLLRLVGGVRSK